VSAETQENGYKNSEEKFADICDDLSFGDSIEDIKVDASRFMGSRRVEGQRWRCPC
jgi:hypothetical protein